MSISQKTEHTLDLSPGLQTSGTGTVLEIRTWEGVAVTEIDLHLPSADITLWKDPVKIRFKQKENCFSDLVPFGWDADTSTCSLLIERANDRSGTEWPADLQGGDLMPYTEILTTSVKIHPTDLIVIVGESSNMATLLALQQSIPAHRFDGVVRFNSPRTGKLFSHYFRTTLTIVTDQNEIENWVLNQNYCKGHTSFYLVGDKKINNGIARLLSEMGHGNIHRLPIFQGGSQ